MKLDVIMGVYRGSDGTATAELYRRLGELGDAGVVAVNLFRACKSSERAKVYTRGRFVGAAYDRKEFSLDNLTRILSERGHRLGLTWGWARDANAQHAHPWVLYVDVPTGQVSFHTGMRGAGPGYDKPWDRQVGTAPARICSWCAQLFESPPDPTRPTTAEILSRAVAAIADEMETEELRRMVSTPLAYDVKSPPAKIKAAGDVAVIATINLALREQSAGYARLFAAAPDMLVALYMALPILEKHGALAGTTVHEAIYKATQGGGS